MASFFLVLEGLDGSGKDAVLSRLLPRFYDESPGNALALGKHQMVARTREPTSKSESGRWIQKKLSDGTLGKESPAEVARHYVLDRRAHGALIRRLLTDGFVVLSSRYDLSTYAYQGAQGIPFGDLYGIHQYDRGHALIPDLTLYFDVGAKTALERIAKRGTALEYFEQESRLAATREKYLEAVDLLRKRDRRAIEIIDAEVPLDEVVARAEAAVARHLGLRAG